MIVIRLLLRIVLSLSIFIQCNASCSDAIQYTNTLGFHGFVLTVVTVDKNSTVASAKKKVDILRFVYNGGKQSQHDINDTYEAAVCI